MTDRTKLKDRARDELFSHINRCGVIHASEEDQKQWMDETMEYLGERYPDLGDTDLRELYMVGIRFCSPAIPHGGTAGPADTEEAPEVAEAVEGEPVGAGAEDSSAV
jgi:hypothetical protein